MEALQIVKFSLKEKWLDFTGGWSAAECDMQDDYVDDGPDLLHELLTGGNGASNKVIAAICADDEDA